MKLKRTVLLIVVVLSAIGISFWFYGAAIEAWTKRLVEQAATHQIETGLVLSAMLASDILLPIPSSLASVACGFSLGFWGGTLASFVGMTLSTLAGYGLGYMASGASTRWIGEREKILMAGFFERYGVWVLLALRPVPMLAETSVLFSGLVRQPFPKVMGMTALGNLTVSAVYAAIGTWGKDTNSFFPAFGAAMLVAGALMWFGRKTRSFSF